MSGAGRRQDLSRFVFLVGRYVRPYRGSIALLLAGSVVVTVLAALGPFIMAPIFDLAFDRRRRIVTAKTRFFAFDGDRLRRTFVDTNSTRVTSVSLLRRLLALAGMRLVGVFSTDDGSGLRRLRRDDPLPMAIAQPKAR